MAKTKSSQPRKTQATLDSFKPLRQLIQADAKNEAKRMNHSTWVRDSAPDRDALRK
jgi:hypothetical protein